jgi:hypothetical protein
MKNYRQQQENGCYTYGDTDMWSVDALRDHAKYLIRHEKKAIGHRQEYLQRSLSHVAFEAWWREHWEPEHSFDSIPVLEEQLGLVAPEA